MKTLTAIILACGLPAATISDVDAAAHATKARHGIICPVTKLRIDSTAVAAGKSVYHGKTYYFCTSNCKTLFEKNPKYYLRK